MGLFERISKGRLYRISISTRSHYQADFCTVIPQFSLVWNVSLWVDVISLTTAAQFCSVSLYDQLNREYMSSFPSLPCLVTIFSLLDTQRFRGRTRFMAPVKSVFFRQQKTSTSHSLSAREWKYKNNNSAFLLAMEQL